MRNEYIILGGSGRARMIESKKKYRDIEGRVLKREITHLNIRRRPRSRYIHFPPHRTFCLNPHTVLSKYKTEKYKYC